MTTIVQLLRDILAVAVPSSASGPVQARHALTQAAFAAAIAELGGDATALAKSVVEASVAYRPPTQTILRLYLRGTHGRGYSDRVAWARVVDAELSLLADAEHQRLATWFIDRSDWLWLTRRQAAPAGLRPSLARLLKEANSDEAKILAASDGLLSMKGLYDYEIAEAAIDLAQRAGSSATPGFARETIKRLLPAVQRIRIHVHQVRFFAAAARVAAEAKDAAAVRERAQDIKATGQELRPGDLVPALRIAFSALRQMSDEAATRELVDSVEAAPPTDGWAAAVVAVAGGEAARLGDADRARRLFARARAEGFAAGMPLGIRRNTAEALFHAVTVADVDLRFEECRLLAPQLADLIDPSLTSDYYPTAQTTLVEQLVDALIGSSSAALARS